MVKYTYHKSYHLNYFLSVEYIHIIVQPISRTLSLAKLKLYAHEIPLRFSLPQVVGNRPSTFCFDDSDCSRWPRINVIMIFVFWGLAYFT